jgi:hypothetical protein
MKTLLKLVTAFACGFVACFCWQFFADCGVEPQVEQKIPSLAEIQKLVGAKPDGIYGEETAAKWDKAVCDQYARLYMGDMK